MGRIRYIKPDFFLDEHLGDLPFEARLAFAGLWCHSDREGRMQDSPKKLKAMIFPYDQVDMDTILDRLCEKPFIVRYEFDGKKYIQVLNFQAHQRPHHTEKSSLIPEFNGELTVKERLIKRRNGEGNGEGNGECVPKKGKQQTTDEEFIKAIKSNPAYKGIDVDLELGKMDAWFLTPKGYGRKKTRKFVLNWLNRAERVVQPEKKRNSVWDKPFPV